MSDLSSYVCSSDLRRVQLGHSLRSLHLVHVAAAEAHATGVGRIVDETLDLDPRLAQGLVELRFDPAQRGVVDRVAQRGHGVPPWRSARALQRSLAMPVMLSIVLARSEEHTSELQSLMRISYAASCLKKKQS